MGCGSWDSSSWSNYKTTNNITDHSTVNTLYTSRSIQSSLDPKGVKMRESCDSDEHPNSNAVIIGLDVTGSMGYLAEEIAKNALNSLITEIYDNKSIVDPQLMIAAIGDSYCDDAPLQVSQFESDIRIAEQLQQIYFESGGGGNGGESYLLLYYFAARHTSIDCMNKRNQKGILFTIGDECCHDAIPARHIEKIFGDTDTGDIMFEDIYNEVSKMYEVYHIVIGDDGGWHGSKDSWRDKIGERAIILNSKDVSRIPQIIEATLELKTGKKLDDITSRYDGSTALVIRDAVGHLSGVSNSVATNSKKKLLEF